MYYFSRLAEGTRPGLLGLAVMTRNQSSIAASAAGMAVCAAVFITALLYQFGWLEGVACLATFVQLLLLSATVVDALEDKQVASGVRSVAAVATAILMVVWLGVTLWTRHGSS